MWNHKDNDGGFPEPPDATPQAKALRFAEHKEDADRPASMASTILTYDSSGLDEEDRCSITKMEDEALPNIEYYAGTLSVKKVASRPTMRELHEIDPAALPPSGVSPVAMPYQVLDPKS